MSEQPELTAEELAKLPYFSRAEIAQHNVASDCWVSFFGLVHDLTPLIKEHKGLMTKPLLNMAGQDISLYFDERTREPKTWIDPNLGVKMFFTPLGPYVHIPPTEPVSTWATDITTPWWSRTDSIVGRVSAKTRRVRIVNQLTGQDHLLEVCSEEALSEIHTRYLKINAHAGSYTWKRLGRPLHMDKTLEDNGIADESEELEVLGEADEFVPTIHIYFNDDLTVA